ncbi:condensin complex subunit 3-like isoform X2 [Photinus pyralis]|uniref:condensin complex subunit 3-like isoform X2 n=1 Tax=Photinus pyralis TaxID=7054 RepID=UPI0012670C02|nr:condensin complex subunit 3-like isoform X2 [Photinus pyralis]
MNENLFKEIVLILEKAQNSTSTHQKCRTLLLNVLKSDLDEFYLCFERLLGVVLNANPKDKNIFAERAIEFITSFCASTQETSEGSFFESVLNFLLSLHDLHSDVVRFRVCQLVGKLLDGLKGNELTEVLCREIEEAMLERVQFDSKSQIRCEAVLGVYRLQNVEDVHCEVIPVLTLHMCNDPSFKVRKRAWDNLSLSVPSLLSRSVEFQVRKVCIEKVHVRREVVAALVSRTRDVHGDVRLAAFKRLSKLVKILKISDRHTVLINGFLDHSKDVVNYVSNQFVVEWLNEYDNDYLNLLRALWMDFIEKHIVESTRVIELVLKALFRVRPYEELLEVLHIGDNRLLSVNTLNWVLVVYWRILIEHFRNVECCENLLDSILPEPVHFASFIREYIGSVMSGFPESQFVLNEFFIIARGYDISDTVSRHALTKLVLDTARSFDLFPDVVVTMVGNLRTTIPNLDERIERVSETISDILYPAVEDARTPQYEFEMATMKIRIHTMEEQLRLAVQEEDYDTAAKLKQEIDASKAKFEESIPPPVTKTTDIPSIIKCLNIARALLLSRDVTCLNPTLRTLNEDITSDFLAHDDLTVRQRSLECYALCCLMDRKWAEKGILIFTSCILANSLSPTNDVHSLIIAIKSVSDLFVLHGESIVEQNEDEDLPKISTTAIIQSLVDLMNDENVELQECATAALCNLIRRGRIHSPPLISRMILKWCNPACNDSEQSRHIIGIMLEELPTLTGASDLLENCVLPTVKTLYKAPKSSPLADVNLYSIVKFMLSLCSICEENQNLHCNLAVKICTEIADKPDQGINVVLSKVLLLLEMRADRDLVDGLANICEDILEDTNNRAVQKNVEKFKVLLLSAGSESEEMPAIQEVEE